MRESCPICNGKGYVPMLELYGGLYSMSFEGPNSICKKCKGSGSIKRVPFMMLGMILLTGWLFYIGHVSAGILALFATIPIALVESD